MIIVEVEKDVFAAEILFDGSMAGVAFMCRDFHSTVAIRLGEQYPNVAVVSNQEYLCELDHINLFGCRSDAPCWTPAMTTEEAEDLERVLRNQEIRNSILNIEDDWEIDFETLQN
jgi:hypothetical protein